MNSTLRFSTPYLEKSLHERVVLHRGPVPVTHTDGTTDEWDGLVMFVWLPRPKTQIRAAGTPSASDLEALFKDDDGVALGLPDLRRVALSNELDEPSGGATTTSEPRVAHVGSPAPVDRLVFSVINGPELWGTRLVESNRVDTRARIRLSAGGWAITLDQRRDLTTYQKELKSVGGYGTTNVGELTRVTGGRFTPRSARRILICLSYYLSFLRGRWVSTALPVGYLGGRVTWVDWSPPGTVDRYLGAFSWFEPTLTEDALSLWAPFVRAWSNPSQRLILRRLISYWVGANAGRTIEVGYTLAVTGLDLIGWYELVVGRVVSSRVWEKKMFTADRIRSILERHRVPVAVPSDLLALSRIAGKRDGPDLLSLARNRFVHPRPKQRYDLPAESLPDTWLLANWYLELCILGWLGYQGRYKRRTDPNRWIGVVERVPWA